MTELCGIYLLTHVETGRKYVGQSKDILERIKYHSYGYGDQKIARSIRKYGFNAFVSDVIELCSVESLNTREQYWITQFNCLSPYGFNLTTGGQQAQKISEETRKRMSIANPIFLACSANLWLLLGLRIFSFDSSVCFLPVFAMRLASMVASVGF